MRKKRYQILLLMCIWGNIILAADTLHLTLSKSIEIARNVSPDANSARHSFRSEYWSWRSFRADYLPQLSLSASPSYDRSINAVTLADGSVKYVEQNLLRTNATVTLSQNVNLTGGNLFAKTSLERLDQFNDDVAWRSVPVTIGYSQSLFGYNSLRWNKKLMPLRYERACREYVETLELISTKTVNMFFALATAQSNYESAKLNYANADTLYRYAKGRYDIGTITENEMLQLEINVLTEETNCINSALNLRDNIQAFRSYLGITEDIPVKAEIEFSLPEFSIDEEIALLYAIDNSPDIKNLQYRKIQSESNVAYARANAGLKADVYLSVGLTQTGEKFRQAYKHPLDQQYVSIGLSFPLLDWGKGRGQVKLALSNRDLIMQQITQNRIDYETDVRKSVNQFNLQRQRVTIAEKTDVTAARRHTVARKLYILGKSTILDLNSAVSEKDSAKRGYISALHSYWNLYYLIRSMTLFDFERNIVLTEDLNQLLK